MTDNVTREEYEMNNKHIEKRMEATEKDVDKLSEIVLGNGGQGLIGKVNALMIRNVWADKVGNGIVGFGSALLVIAINYLISIWNP